MKVLLAEGEYSRIHWGKGQNMMMRKALKKWQTELSQDQFVRVHRRAIINLAFLEFVDKDANGNPRVHVRDFKGAIPVSHRAKAVFNRSLKSFRAFNPH